MTMQQYFGPIELKPRNERLTSTPVGEKCVLCRIVIAPDDAGQVNSVGQVMHYECLIRVVVGSVSHQQCQCSCFGGTDTDHDESGIAFRRGAIAATDLFRRSELLRKEREAAETTPTDDAFWLDPGNKHQDVS